MTIKEIEELSGLSRANVRYYETEGMIHPNREKNGYRDYSEEDLQILKKIKLLRSLHVSLEDIKALQNGTQDLDTFLEKHIQELEAKRDDYECSVQICRKICDEGAQYGTLNTKRYLEYMERSFKENSSILGEETTEDVVPREIMPWRRFFARRLDLILYIFVWNLFWIYVLGNRGTSHEVIAIIAGLLLMFLVEPVLLAVFGTTPGKWILGLYVIELGGAKPDYTVCRQRTMSVMWHGLGLEIPGYSWFRMYKSYKSNVNKEDMAWEYRTDVCCKRDTWGQIFAYTFVCLFVVVALTFVTMEARMPNHRGDISAAEFCEDFNELADYYGWFPDSDLLPSGKWSIEEPTQGTVVIYTMENHESPDFQLIEKSGALTGICFEDTIVLPANEETESAFGMVVAYRSEMALAVLTYLKAQKEYPFWSGRAEEIANYILQDGYRDFSYEEYGVRITYDIEYSGFHDVGEMLMRAEEATEARCSFSFEMMQVDER